MTKPVWSVVFDKEANGLLNDDSIDYTSVPYKLKPSFKLHCIVAEVKVGDKVHVYAFYDGPTIVLDGRAHKVHSERFNVDYVLEEGYEPIEYIHRPLRDWVKFVQAIPEGSTIIGHNIINYDLLVSKLYFGIPYEVERDMSIGAPLGDDYWAGKKVIFDDTLVRAKTLNPDRFGGNSLDALSQKGDVQKVQFRKYLPQDRRFEEFAPDMLYYNIFDMKANRAVAGMLNMEMAEYDWNEKWHSAIKLEKAVMELITRQEHRGFKFDMELAQKNLAELDAMMEERRVKIEAILPARPATKALMNEFTPPKNQFKKNGEPSAHMVNFVKKIGGEFTEEGKLLYNGQILELPLPAEPLVTTMPAKVSDTTFIKDWLVGLGWNPSEYKEKDITVDVKKNKLPHDKLEAAITKYIEQTVTSNFRVDRCEHLQVQGITKRSREDTVRAKLEYVFGKRMERRGGIKVLTNPSFTVGQEKEICPDLTRLATEKPEYACIIDIVEYLTYRHRRNSILGGGADWDEDEEPEKGYLSAVRADGRIPTPADTCGAATSRMKHRLVANVPRVTSLYGAMMRAMFGVDTEECYQIGYDFDSLEAREEAHFCWEHEPGELKEYCNSLLLDKPNDVHTKMAEKISAIIAREFARGPAKSVKYGCTYGAQAAKVAKTIGSDLETGQQVFDAFWEAAFPLKDLKTALLGEWKKYDKRRIVGIDKRLIPTRAEHAILNSKFQSSGVICAKRAMVLHDRKLRANGLLLDFFTESTEGREWCQQLIAYHDEAQAEVSKRSMKFKMFETKEEAQAFKDHRLAVAGEIWSDIKPSPKGGFFVAYCKAGHLAVEAVSEVGKDYGMNVDLTAGYMVGRNWKECH